jgi:esterase/lipase
MNQKQKVFISFALIFFFLNAYAQNDSICTSIAVESVQWLKNDKSEKLYQHFTKNVADKLSKDNTKLIWNQLIEQYGNYNKIDTFASNLYEKNSLIIDCILNFEKGDIKYRLTFNNENKIAGIFFIPHKAAKAKDREPIKSDDFEESKFYWDYDSITFPSMLCIPTKQPIKAFVIFVHGSGPNDMDETIGPNKIFQQIAHNLAKQGIGSMRYDKRTYIAQQSKNKLSFPTDIQHIAINDAVAATKYASKIEGLEDVPIYIVGHSMEANAAPLIAQESDIVKGIILMAGNARPLEDLIVEQYKHIYARGGYSKAEKKDIKNIKKKAKNVKKLKKCLQSGKKVDLPLTNDTTFWLSMNNYDAVETAKTLSIPILVLQGERDYQVTMTDFYIWKKELSNNPKNKFISYPSLNHLFIAGEGLSYPQEYQHQGDVSKIMLSDMATWIIDVSNNAQTH